MTLLAYKKEIIAGALLAGALFSVFPFMSFGDEREVLYVDKNASGTQNGSKSHPFRTIDQAMNAADDEADIHIASGTYKEDVKIEKNVRLYGAGTGKTVIKADHDETVVTMKHKTRVENLTITGGDLGIFVRKNSRAEIYNVVVKDNDHEGIFIDGDSTSDKYKVRIDNSTIEENGRAGIYSKKRKLTIEDSEIKDNGSDGIILEKRVKAWLEDDLVKDNKKSGIRVELDDANIDIIDLTIRSNGREGIEIDGYYRDGKVHVDNTRFEWNDRYGVARVIRDSAPVSIFDGVTFHSSNKYKGNNLGGVSDLIRIQ